MHESISQYGRKTQERIIAAQYRHGAQCAEVPSACIAALQARPASGRSSIGFDHAAERGLPMGRSLTAPRTASTVLDRSIALAQTVREAEDRAAVTYSATLRGESRPWWEGTDLYGYDADVPSLAPSGTD